MRYAVENLHGVSWVSNDTYSSSVGDLSSREWVERKQTLFKMALSILHVIISLLHLFYCMVESIVIRLIPIKYRSKDISGQIALVTGAGGGIGRLLALGLANLGCKVVCWDVAKQGMLFWLFSPCIVVLSNHIVYSKWGNGPIN